MAAQSTPTVEDKRTAVFAVQQHVVEEHVVAPECLRQALGVVAGEVLLPVNPPEVHSLLLTLTNDVVEHRAVERRVFQHPGHTVASESHV